MAVAAKYWTLLELLDKVREDMDLQEETFISDSELTSAANEAIDQAEQEVNTIYEDYFLTDVKIALQAGVEKYNLPSKIYAHKIRRIIFEDGTDTYKIKRMGDWKKFEQKALENVGSSCRTYEYMLVNDSQGMPQISLVPTSSHTSYTRTISASNNTITFTDDDGTFAVAISSGTYTDPDAIAFAAEAAMNTSGTSQLHSVTFNAQEMKFEFVNTTGAVLTLSWGTGASSAYYAFGFSALDLTGAFQYQGQAAVLTSRATCWYFRQANRLEFDEDILDIPEAANFVLRFMKNRVMEKEHNPMLQEGVRLLSEERALMVSTLTAMVPDAENNIEPDFTMYEEMS